VAHREPTAAQAIYQRRLRRQLDPFNRGIGKERSQNYELKIS